MASVCGAARPWRGATAPAPPRSGDAAGSCRRDPFLRSAARRPAYVQPARSVRAQLQRLLDVARARRPGDEVDRARQAALRRAAGAGVLVRAQDRARPAARRARSRAGRRAWSASRRRAAASACRSRRCRRRRRSARPVRSSRGPSCRLSMLLAPVGRASNGSLAIARRIGRLCSRRYRSTASGSRVAATRAPWRGPPRPGRRTADPPLEVEIGPRRDQAGGGGHALDAARR